MLCFYYYCNAKWVQALLYRLKYLSCQSFLDLEAPCENIHSPCKFAQSCNVTIGYIGDVSLAKKWKKMVFTHGIKFDTLYNYHFAYFLMKFCRIQYGNCILLVTLCYILHGLSH